MRHELIKSYSNGYYSKIEMFKHALSITLSNWIIRRMVNLNIYSKLIVVKALKDLIKNQGYVVMFEKFEIKIALPNEKPINFNYIKLIELKNYSNICQNKISSDFCLNFNKIENLTSILF
jgi:hypothetical protein